MKYAQLKKRDVANGPGVRVSLFVSGCTHHCKGCFNPETWDFDYGDIFDEKIQDEIEDAEDDEIVITCSDEYYDTIKERTMVYSYDSHSYAIGLIGID